MWLFDLFFPQFCKYDMSNYGYFEVFKKVPKTEITRVDCSSCKRYLVRTGYLFQPSLIHYENTPIEIYWKCYNQKLANFQIRNCDIIHISSQNIDCEYSLEPPRRGGSNEYPESMFFKQTKKNNMYPCKPQFYYIRVGLRGSKLYIGMFSW